MIILFFPKVLNNLYSWTIYWVYLYFVCLLHDFEQRVRVSVFCQWSIYKILFFRKRKSCSPLYQVKTAQSMQTRGAISLIISLWHEKHGMIKTRTLANSASIRTFWSFHNPKPSQHYDLYKTKRKVTRSYKYHANYLNNNLKFHPVFVLPF